MFNAADHYLNLGLCVIPTNADKTPAVDELEPFFNRSSTPEELEEWYTQGQERGVGIVTGPVSGRIVLDADVKNDGLGQLEGYELPDTQTARTMSGGLHYHYAWDERLRGTRHNKRAIFGQQGVDLRGLGGYVVAPPSPGYSWLRGPETPLSKPPEWLIELFTKPQQSTELYDGPRHPYFFKRGCFLFEKGFTYEQVERELRELANTFKQKWDESRFQREMDGVWKWVESGQCGRANMANLRHPEPKSTTPVTPFKVDLTAYLNELSRRSKYDKPEFTTGFGCLDRLTKGFPRENLYVIGAPTNGGKTQFVLQSIQALLKTGKRVLYCSTEMPQSEIVDRFNSIGSGVSINALQTGRLNVEQHAQLVAFLEETDTSNLFIYPEDTPTLDGIRTAVENNKPDILILDHMHHIRLFGENRRTEIDDFIMGLKKLVLEKHIPAVITAQLRRKDPIPGQDVPYSMHDFKESGGIENEAGVCVLLCPPAEWTTDRFQTVTAYVPKNRHGRREMRFSLTFDTLTAKFEEPT